MKKLIILLLCGLFISGCSQKAVEENENVEVVKEPAEIEETFLTSEDELLILVKNKLQEKGYKSEEVILLIKELKIFELTPILVFDYISDIELYIEDCKNHRDTNNQDYFILTNSYTNYYQDTIKSTDFDQLDVLVNKKYHFPANYTPELKSLSDAYARDNMSMVKEAAEMFMKMSDEASLEGLRIYGTSGFRSYDRQEYLYNNYVSKWGQAEADLVSARPGHSEHQTGLVMDLTIDGGLSSFTGTAEHQWMLEHSYEYGFILRYPEKKSIITGYNAESWHYRYLGVELATKVNESHLTYDEYYNLYSKS
jgi:LAS superfamily LD-carboxypeptidase LdcB